jgi:acetamidase/formamidase
MATIEILCEKKDYSFLFTPYKPAVAWVRPGDDVFVNTPDALMSTINDKSDVFSICNAKERHLNPIIGPIHIEGSEPGDTLVVRILGIEYSRDYAVSCFVPDFGALVGSPGSVSVLNGSYPEHTYIWELCDGGKAFHERELDITIPAEPFLGCIGVAPDHEAITSLTAGWYGGNLDVPCICPGNTVYLPVTREGALFFCGDCHGRQGQGEICGVALEIPARIHLVFDLIKGDSMNIPRVESENEIMVIGSARPLEEACRLAYIGLIRWMEKDFGFGEMNAYELLTQVGKLYVGNFCDPNCSVVASIERRYLKPTGFRLDDTHPGRTA